MKGAHPTDLQQGGSIHAAEELDEPGHTSRPASLVTCAETRAVVALEILIEKKVSVPVRIGLKNGVAAEDRPAA